jgi:DHA3 family macrolide efflux protein-like MFS transporter
MFMVGKVTGSAAMVGLVSAAETLPFLLFSAYSGVLADRIDRRGIMLISDLASSAVLILFVSLVFFVPTPPAWTMVLTPFLLSCTRVFFMPAKSAAIPALVPESLLMAANSLSSLTQSIAPMIGLALSMSILGTLYALAKGLFFPVAILVNLASFLISAFYVRRLPTIVPDRKQTDTHAWMEFREGLSYLRHHKVLRVYLVSGTLVSLMIAPFFVAFVEANNRRLGGTPQGLAGMELTFFVGLVIASALVSKFIHRRPGLGYIFCVVTVGIAVAGMGWCRTIWQFCILNVISGLTIPFCDVPLNTYIQMEVEDALRGRVNSVMNMLRMGVMPVGALLGGRLVEQAGVTVGFLVMGGGMALAGLIGLSSRAFRNAEIRETEPQILAESSLKLASNE